MAAIKVGQVFFTKSAKHTSMGRRTPEYRLPKDGHFFGLMLGTVNHLMPDPPTIVCLRQLGASGFISLDDVAEFLGVEQMETCRKKFEDKYSSVEKAAAAELAKRQNGEAPPPPEEPKEPSGLVSPSGAPL